MITSLGHCNPVPSISPIVPISPRNHSLLSGQRRKSLLGLILSHSLSLSVFAMEQMSLLRIRVTRFGPHAPARDVWGASVTSVGRSGLPAFPNSVTGPDEYSLVAAREEKRQEREVWGNTPALKSHHKLLAVDAVSLPRPLPSTRYRPDPISFRRGLCHQNNSLMLFQVSVMLCPHRSQVSVQPGGCFTGDDWLVHHSISRGCEAGPGCDAMLCRH